MKSPLKVIKNNRGQILVEYLLLMVIGIACATLLTKKMVNRDENNPGMVISTWDRILHKLGSDVPDCVNPTCN